MYNEDYNLYKIFIVLYEEMSVSKAAEKLFVSQPAISYNLKELEKNVGYKLFNRTPKGIKPTAEADLLYKYTLSGLNIIDEGKLRLRELASLEDGIIKIGTPSHVGIFYVSKIIKEFKALYPNIRIEIYSKSTKKLIELFETRKLNIIIDMLPINIKDDITKEVVGESTFCFAFSKKYFKESIIKNEKDLLKYPLILQETNSSYNRNIIEFLQLKGISVTPYISSWTSEMTMQLVREGVGVGYFLKDIIDVQPDKDDYKVITFNDSLPKISICAVYNDELISPAEREFIRIMRLNK